MALHLLHDPQDFAEKLFRRLEKATEKFELRLMMMALIARLTGVHQVAWGGCGLKPGVGVAKSQPGVLHVSLYVCVPP